MVIQFMQRYDEDPTNTYIKDFDYPIFKMPFPAVTICPFSPISLQRRLKIMDGAILPENVTRELAMTFLKYGHHIMLPYTPVKKYKHMDKLQMFLKENKWTVMDFVKNLKPCEDVVEACWWSSERIDCNKFIKISLTSYGCCCSFNYLLEEFVGREKQQPNPRPLASVDFGRRSGLKLVIKKDVLNDDDIGENELDEVIVHHSMEFPGLNSNSYAVQKHREMQISIKGEAIIKPEGLDHLNSANQKVPVCIPGNINTLEYFPTYRYLNCYTNCRIKMMIRVCGCLPYIFSNIAEHYKIKRCGLKGLICIQEHSKEISIDKDVIMPNFTCSCRAPCQELVYDSFPNSMYLTKTNASSSYIHVSEESAVLRVFMNSQVFQITETLPAADEVYLLGNDSKQVPSHTFTFEETIFYCRIFVYFYISASIGGIFSLFLGCSFLSLVEIVYFGGLLCRAIFLRPKIKSTSKRKRIVHDSHVDPPSYNY
ncbi:sodium channel protein Nach-like isoform X2 [Hylaeus volcanicus]|uniref:sodium channel protein Nach-like isoform X2 n=1 Tax=Hylaeus volcanicus TaxID=313075 RepID=UPI0023B83D25|nr:sodium channel protein Nach-like isoform X2 [Hylaeus volcanicus]